MRKKRRGETHPSIPGRGACPRCICAGCPCIHSSMRAYGEGLQGGCSNIIILLFNTDPSTPLEMPPPPIPLQPRISHPCVAGVPWLASPCSQPSQKPILPGVTGYCAEEAAPHSPVSLLSCPPPHDCPALLPVRCSPLCMACSAVASAAP